MPDNTPFYDSSAIARANALGLDGNNPINQAAVKLAHGQNSGDWFVENRTINNVSMAQKATLLTDAQKVAGAVAAAAAREAIAASL